MLRTYKEAGDKPCKHLVIRTNNNISEAGLTGESAKIKPWNQSGKVKREQFGNLNVCPMGLYAGELPYRDVITSKD